MVYSATPLSVLAERHRAALRRLRGNGINDALHRAVDPDGAVRGLTWPP